MNASCCVWGIFWLIILFFIGWPISVFLGAVYGLVAPITTFIGLDEFSEALLQGVNMGRLCAKNARVGKPAC